MSNRVVLDYRINITDSQTMSYLEYQNSHRVISTHKIKMPSTQKNPQWAPLY